MTAVTHAPTFRVRNHYKDQGYEVHISREGHVEFREEGGEWREGRWVSEYRIIDGQVVLT